MATLNELVQDLIIAKQALPDVPDSIQLVWNDGWTAEFGVFMTNEAMPTAEDALNVVLWKVRRNKRGV